MSPGTCSRAAATSMLLVAGACRAAAPRRTDSAGRTAAVAARPAPPLDLTVVPHAVEGPPRFGMAARIRWALSPDSAALLVVLDPRGVENEPVPNAFLYAREGWGTLERGAVWDVTPSPGWRWLAYGEAFVVRPEDESSEVTASAWRPVRRRTGLGFDQLANGSFAASGMSMARGIAQPVVIDLERDAGVADSGARLPRTGGWRVRWTIDTLLAVGANPRRANDDAPSPGWALVDPRTMSARGVLADTARLAPVEWVEGPQVALAMPVDLGGARTIGTSRYVLRGDSGAIAITDTTASGGGRTGAVGPGLLLTATRSGDFIAALAPRADSAAGEPPVRLVVYEVRRR